jgi:hypothetical protein
VGLDLVLSLAVVGGAVAFLVWHFSFRGRKKNCHPAPEGDQVVLGPALKKAMKKAQKKTDRPSPF